MDFLVTHGNEREAAGSHLHALSENDVVVYDRGYFSRRCFVSTSPGACIRCSGCVANGAVAAFANSTETAEIAARPGREEPLRLRSTYWEPRCWTGPRIAELSDLYHERWGIEELYKVSKQMIGIEDLDSAASSRSFPPDHTDPAFSNQGRPARGQPGNSRSDADESELQEQPAGSRTNLEGLFLQQAAALDNTLRQIVDGIVSCRQKLRPNRSYDRSRKPGTPQVGKGPNEMKEKTR